MTEIWLAHLKISARKIVAAEEKMKEALNEMPDGDTFAVTKRWKTRKDGDPVYVKKLGKDLWLRCDDYFDDGGFMMNDKQVIEMLAGDYKLF